MTLPQPTGGFAWTQAATGLALICEPLRTVAPHLFTTASVRLREDAGEWTRVASAIGVPPEGVRLLHQVHGRAVAVALKGEAPPASWPEADIIISSDPTTAIGVRTADCAAILLADRTQPVVGAAHAGWRGTMQNVAGRAVEAMTETFGTDPANLIAAVGPCLGQCCGEMGPEVVDQFRDAAWADDEIERWFKPGSRGRPHLDLWRANADQLERAGVPAAAVHVAGLCTRCRPDLFHSYRAAGSAAAGRMAGVIRPAN
jgi:purine-nucleoside/S-methyl-5'-thioadenosine phosphorylase / adenosine deaminase